MRRTTMRWFGGVVFLLAASACECGFHSVDDCDPSSCVDAGVGGGTASGGGVSTGGGGVASGGGIATGGGASNGGGTATGGGTSNGGGDATGGGLATGGGSSAGGGGGGGGEVADAGPGLDAGFDAGALDSGIDAGFLDAGGCYATLDALDGGLEDVVTVQGVIGDLGAVDYSIAGTSAHTSPPEGCDYDTVPWSSRNLPANLSRSHFGAMLTSPVVEGDFYALDNWDAIINNPPFMDFSVKTDDGGTARIYACPPRAGSGGVTFTQYQVTTPIVTVQGAFEFDCPDAGISVMGCFRYH